MDLTTPAPAPSAHRQRRAYRVGADIGGTFTDIVVLADDGTWGRRKVPSTVDDYGEAIAVGLTEIISELETTASAVLDVLHGTTVATNAILQGRGAETALVTTRGFRDVLELRRIRIPELYNLWYEKPPPLVRRRLRYEVDERVGPDGAVIETLDPGSVERVVDSLTAANVDAVAVALLHSYVNPEHELRVAEAIRQRLPHLYVTCSSDILPEIREYERSSTAVINAYVGPVVGTYLRRLRERLDSIAVTAPLRVMQSSGGVMSAEAAIDRPAYLVESGPAAGVVGSLALARRAGYDKVLTFDMGGTTAKASAIEGGEPAQTSEYEVGAGLNVSSLLVAGGGYALKLPAIDISEIGAGGGSIVTIDRGGRLQVGPQSAGASPGPVCYGAGGEEPTVTDANVVLGYINPAQIAGGRVELDVARAHDALEERLAQPLGLSVRDTAYGIHAIANARMVRAVKAVSTHRGRDPRDFVLFAFGGSGPVHAGEMARELGIARVVVPPAAGLFSAFGLLFSEMQHSFVQTFLHALTPDCLDRLNTAFRQLQEKALESFRHTGEDAAPTTFARAADVRYIGQGFELTVPVHTTAALTTADLRAIAGQFGDEHRRTYGHRSDDAQAEIVNIRVSARVEVHGFDAEARFATPATVTSNRGGRPQRDAYFGPRHGGLVTTRLIERSELHGATINGPAIVDEYDATCVVPPGFSASLDEQGSIVLDAL